MKNVVMFSTGLASAVALDMVQRKQGRENTIALITDTNWEDEDNYRFGNDVIRYLGANMVRVSDGRTPPDIWLQGGYLVGPTGAPCTRKLKIEQTIKFIKQQNEPVTLYFGIGKDEEHRKYNLIQRYSLVGAKCVFPLIDSPMTPCQMTDCVQKRMAYQKAENVRLRF